MNKADSAKRKKILVFAACALLLILGSAAGTFMYARARGSGGRTPGNSISSLLGKRVTPALTLTARAANQPLFYDDFTDTSKGWYQGSVPGYTRVIANNTLTLADANHEIMPESLPTTSIFKDFKVTVTYTLIQAAKDDSVGLYIRGDSYLDRDYRIDMYANKMYAISKETLHAGKHQVQYLVEPTIASALKPPGQPNTIGVMMKGARLVLELNGKIFASMSDPDYISGQIALFVQNSPTSSGVEASIENIAVYPLAESLPLPTATGQAWVR
jgi:hypothetical protein